MFKFTDWNLEFVWKNMRRELTHFNLHKFYWILCLCVKVVFYIIHSSTIVLRNSNIAIINVLFYTCHTTCNQLLFLMSYLSFKPDSFSRRFLQKLAICDTVSTGHYLYDTIWCGFGLGIYCSTECFWYSFSFSIPNHNCKHFSLSVVISTLCLCQCFCSKWTCLPYCRMASQIPCSHLTVTCLF